MTIDASDFNQHMTTDLASLVGLARNFGMVPIVRFVEKDQAWAIYGPTLLIDDTGRRLFGTCGDACDLLISSGATKFLVDAT